MKDKILFIVFLFFISSKLVNSQPSPNKDTTIYTPRNSAVNAIFFLGDDYTTFEADSLDNLYLADYPGSILIESSSRKYNCHGYAWALIENDIPVWIDGYNDLSPYWSDSSYINVNNIQNSTKIAFQVWQQPGKIDHSAVPTSDPDTIISKWANGPLMKHHINKSPWPATGYTLIYYKLNLDNISGSALICGPLNYTIPYLTPTTFITWTASDMIDIEWFGSGQTASAQPYSSTVYGYNKYVTAHVKTKYIGLDEGEDIMIDLADRTKQYIHVCNTPSNVQIHVPVEPIYGETDAMVWASSDPGDETYIWQVIGGTIVSQNGAELIVNADCPSRRGLTLRVKATNDCGESDYISRNVAVDCSGGINPLSISPNPADTYATLTIDVKQKNSGKKQEEVYIIKIYNNTNLCILDKKITSTEFSINTQSFTEGIYYVHLILDNKKYIRMLIVIH